MQNRLLGNSGLQVFPLTQRMVDGQSFPDLIREGLPTTRTRSVLIPWLEQFFNLPFQNGGLDFHGAAASRANASWSKHS